MVIKATTLSNLFINLSSGAFGLVILTPGFLSGTSLLETFSVVIRALSIGIIFLLLAELFNQETSK